MKSKAEMADALQIHMLAPDCKGCAYLHDVANGSFECYKEMMDDIITLLNKSDFEVMKEILKRSKEAGYYHYTAMSGRECLEIPFLRFDEEGNIL